MTAKETRSIIFYDGVCAFCDSTVQFILKRDKRDFFLFSPLQGDLAQNLLKDYGLEPKNLDTIVLFHKDKVYVKSEAAIKIASLLPISLVHLARLAKIFPRSFNDWIYDIIAKYRYRVFGKKDSCEMLGPEQRKKFIG